jgi:hypothetical protein
MNFFVADVQTGFGAFVAFYLAHRDWSVRDVQASRPPQRF